MLIIYVVKLEFLLEHPWRSFEHGNHRYRHRATRRDSYRQVVRCLARAVVRSPDDRDRVVCMIVEANGKPMKVASRVRTHVRHRRLHRNSLTAQTRQEIAGMTPAS